jgi:flagellar biosynthesis chaperone FliJ
MLYLTSLADQADKGNSEAQQEFSRIMKNKAAVEQKLKNN